MGIEDGLGEAADQAKKVVTGSGEDQPDKQQDDSRDELREGAEEAKGEVNIGKENNMPGRPGSGW
ncbi:hypothetical protein AB0H82_35435 [Streptomyces sp. NPDC050732]|uniref:hypothetical protein n=1 Tax=Streptomyces sp. NPDC050732 TaxID=3154632 RepID=UPI003431F52A